MTRWAVLVVAVLGVGFLGCQDPTEKLSSANSDECISGLRAVADRGRAADVELVAQATHHQDAVVATEAVRALGRIRAPAAAEALKKVAVAESRPVVREEAVLVLGRQDEAPPVDVLVNVMKSDPAPRVRAAAVSGLARVGSPANVPTLLDVAERDVDEIVQSRAVGAAETLLGLSFGFDPNASPEERAKVLARMRKMGAAAAAKSRPRRGPNK